MWVRFALASKGMVSSEPLLPHVGSVAGYAPTAVQVGSPVWITKSSITLWKNIPS